MRPIELAILNNHISSEVDEDMSLDDALEALGDSIDIWEPFEYWDVDDLCFHIKCIVDAVDREMKQEE